MKRDFPEDVFLEEEEEEKVDKKKLARVVDELEKIWLRDNLPEVFITNVLKFLTIYELEKLYKMQSKEMKAWWDTYNVWYEICRTEMKTEFRAIEASILKSLPENYVLNYKWLLFVWECYAAITKKNSDIRKILITIARPKIGGDKTMIGEFYIFFKNDEIIIQPNSEKSNFMFSYYAGSLKIPMNACRPFRFSNHIFMSSFSKDVFFKMIYAFFVGHGYFLKRTDIKTNDTTHYNYPYIRNKIEDK